MALRGVVWMMDVLYGLEMKQGYKGG